MKIKNLIKHYVLSSVFIMLTFSSCSGFFSAAKKENVEVKFQTILPAEFKKDFEQDSRSATPSFAAASFVYDITAARTDETSSPITKTVNGSSYCTEFSLPLVPKLKWKISVKAKVTGSADYIFEGETQEIEVTYEASTTPFTIPLSAKTLGSSPENKGNLALEIYVDKDAEITSLEISNLLLNGNIQVPDILTVSSVEESNLKKYTIKADGIAAGKYLLQLCFKNGDSLKYILTTSIIIFKGLTTDTWRSENELDADGKFVITKELTEKFISSTLFVKGTSGEPENFGTFTTYDSLQNAVDYVLQSNKQSQKDYRIFVSGTVEDNIEITGTEKDLNLTIEGYSGNNADSIQPGNGSSTPNVTVTGGSSNTVSVKLKNISVLGNYAASGLYIDKATVELENTIITGCNRNSGEGGGIYVSKAENSILKLSEGTEVKDNRASNGGGIYIASENTGGTVTSGKIEINGCVKVTGNYNQQSGNPKASDIYFNCDNTKIKITGSLTSTNGDSEIGISYAKEDFNFSGIVTDTNCFTEDYSVHNNNIYPSKYFFCNEGYNIAINTADEEAYFVKSGGIIKTSSSNKVIFSLNKNEVESKIDDDDSRKITLSVTVNGEQFEPQDYELFENDFQMKLYAENISKITDYIGDPVEETESYSLVVPQRTYSGNYILFVSLKYDDGVTYSDEFPVTVTDSLNVILEKTILNYGSANEADKKIAVKKACFNTADLQEISYSVKNDQEHLNYSINENNIIVDENNSVAKEGTYTIEVHGKNDSLSYTQEFEVQVISFSYFGTTENQSEVIEEIDGDNKFIKIIPEVRIKKYVVGEADTDKKINVTDNIVINLLDENENPLFIYDKITKETDLVKLNTKSFASGNYSIKIEVSYKGCKDEFTVPFNKGN